MAVSTPEIDAAVERVLRSPDALSVGQARVMMRAELLAAEQRGAAAAEARFAEGEGWLCPTCPGHRLAALREAIEKKIRDLMALGPAAYRKDIAALSGILDLPAWEQQPQASATQPSQKQPSSAADTSEASHGEGFRADCLECNQSRLRDAAQRARELLAMGDAVQYQEGVLDFLRDLARE